MSVVIWCLRIALLVDDGSTECTNAGDAFEQRQKQLARYVACVRQMPRAGAPSKAGCRHVMRSAGVVHVSAKDRRSYPKQYSKVEREVRLLLNIVRHTSEASLTRT